MQDPLFHLTPDAPVDLNTLFGPASSSMDGGGEGDASLGESTSESGTLESEDAEQIEQVIEENKEEEEPEEGTLEERIKKIEEEYNENPIPIYGRVQERLVTLAKTLHNNKLSKQSSLICDILCGK